MPARPADTYRAARHNHARRMRRRPANMTPPTLLVVEGMLRAWLMRRRGVYNAPPFPPIRSGPSKHGKCIIATHLSIQKAKIAEAKRRRLTGISCAPGPHKRAGSTHAVGESWRHYAEWLLRRIANKEKVT